MLFLFPFCSISVLGSPFFVVSVSADGLLGLVITCTVEIGKYG